MTIEDDYEKLRRALSGSEREAEDARSLLFSRCADDKKVIYTFGILQTMLIRLNRLEARVEELENEKLK
jgi:hypothetical protein